MIDLSNQILKKTPKNNKYYLIAIDGRGASGKTTLSKYVVTLLPYFAIINGDDYFEPDDTTIASGSFNEKRFSNDVINPLQSGKTVFSYYPYHWHSKPHISKTMIKIKKGIVLERSYSFSFDLDYDLKIWVQTPEEVALKRGVERDQMPEEQGIKQWKEVWQPKENSYFEKVKPLENADIIIDGLKSFEEQLI